MITCSKAAQLLSERRDRKLGFGERVGLRVHLLLCRMCVAYHDKLEHISRFAQHAGDMLIAERHGFAALSDDAKERMKRRLSGLE